MPALFVQNARVEPEFGEVKDQRKIAERYVKSWFVLDVLSCLPIDVVPAENRPLPAPLASSDRALEGSFSAVTKPNFASKKYSRESS